MAKWIHVTQGVDCSSCGGAPLGSPSGKYFCSPTRMQWSHSFQLQHLQDSLLYSSWDHTLPRQPPANDWAWCGYQDWPFLLHETPLTGDLYPRSPCWAGWVCQSCIMTWGSPHPILLPLSLSFTGVTPNKLLILLTLSQQLFPKRPKPTHPGSKIILTRKMKTTYICNTD